MISLTWCRIGLSKIMWKHVTKWEFLLLLQEEGCRIMVVCDGFETRILDICNTMMEAFSDRTRWSDNFLLIPYAGANWNPWFLLYEVSAFPLVQLIAVWSTCMPQPPFSKWGNQMTPSSGLSWRAVYGWEFSNLHIWGRLLMICTMHSLIRPLVIRMLKN